MQATKQKKEHALFMEIEHSYPAFQTTLSKKSEGERLCFYPRRYT